MFDIWLTESTKLVKEIIEKSNLKDITEAVVKDFMTTETFAKFIEEQVEVQAKHLAEEYIENIMLNSSEDGCRNMTDYENRLIRRALEKVSVPTGLNISDFYDKKD